MIDVFIIAEKKIETSHKAKVETYMEIKRLDPGVRFNQATIFNNTIYVSGQIAKDATADLRGQTEQILSQIVHILDLAGSSKNQILMVNIWLSDIADVAIMNEVWDAWVPKSHMPARATVESKLVSPEYKIEISCIAACN